MFGADGKLAVSYTPTPNWTNSTSQATITFTGSTRVYFAGKLIKQGGSNVAQDRLGSVGKYYPYGEERNSPPLANDQVKFASYTRDSATGLDYADDDSSFYSAPFGRFHTALNIPSRSSKSEPSSWNRYRYEGNDPINNVSEPSSDPCDFIDCHYGGGDPPQFECPSGSHDNGNDGCDPDQEPVGGGGLPLLLHSRIAGFQEALNALDSPECAEALGAVNGEAAKIALNNKDIFLDDSLVATAHPLPDGTVDIAYQSGNVSPEGVETVSPTVFLNPSAPIPGTAGVELPGIAGLGPHNVLEVEQSVHNLKPLTTEDFQAITLLHELGHLLGGLPTDRGDVMASERNTQKVIDNCLGFLKR